MASAQHVEGLVVLIRSQVRRNCGELSHGEVAVATLNRRACSLRLVDTSAGSVSTSQQRLGGPRASPRARLARDSATRCPWPRPEGPGESSGH